MKNQITPPINLPTNAPSNTPSKALRNQLLRQCQTLIQQCARRFSLQSLSIVALTVLLLITGCTNPVQADAIDPKLEKQVLEIIRKNPVVILEAVDAYQRQQQEKQANDRQAGIDKVLKNTKDLIGTSPKQGQGKILLVEFSDFQCPFCAAAHKNVKAFMAKQSTAVTLIYKHLPLEQIHPEAKPAAKAAWAAQQQNKFWEFHDILFSNQKQLNDAFYQDTAKKLGLDIAKFNRDRTSSAAETAIAADLALAEKLQINGTPTFIMNGQLFSGAVPIEDFEQRLKPVK
jgi:protein-disulfide isomerase